MSSTTDAQKRHQNNEAVKEHRKNKNIRCTLAADNSCYLFVVHDNKSSYDKIRYHPRDPDGHEPVWEQYPLLNHCIHKLCAPTTEQLRNINIRLNHKHNHQKEEILECIEEAGSEPLTQKEDPGHPYLVMPDHNHAFGVNFFSSGIDQFNNPVYKNVYFIRLSAIMKDLTQASTKDALLTFLQQNFDIICWTDPGWDDHKDGDDTLFEGSEGRKLYLNFLMEAKNKCNVLLYPPLPCFFRCEDKHLQKHYIGSLGLPSKFLMLPPLDKDKRARWMDLTWEELYQQLNSLDSFAPPIVNGPIDGIVLKPKEGAVGRDVVILNMDVKKKKLVVRHPVLGVSTDGKPSDWKSLEDISTMFICEPFCSALEDNEHRLYLHKSAKKSIKVFAEINAHYINDGQFLLESLQFISDLSKEYGNLPHFLFQKVQGDHHPPNEPFFFDGVVFRVDVCKLPGGPYMEGDPWEPDQNTLWKPRPGANNQHWFVNELQVICGSGTHIKDYFLNSNILDYYSDQFKVFVNKSYDNNGATP